MLISPGYKNPDYVLANPQAQMTRANDSHKPTFGWRYAAHHRQRPLPGLFLAKAPANILFIRMELPDTLLVTLAPETARPLLGTPTAIYFGKSAGANDAGE